MGDNTEEIKQLNNILTRSNIKVETATDSELIPLVANFVIDYKDKLDKQNVVLDKILMNVGINDISKRGNIIDGVMNLQNVSEALTKQNSLDALTSVNNTAAIQGELNATEEDLPTDKITSIKRKINQDGSSSVTVTMQKGGRKSRKQTKKGGKRASLKKSKKTKGKSQKKSRKSRGKK